MTPPWEGVLGECGLSFFAVGGLHAWVSNDSPAVLVLIAIDCRVWPVAGEPGGDDLMMEHGGRRAQGVLSWLSRAIPVLRTQCGQKALNPPLENVLEFGNKIEHPLAGCFKLVGWVVYGAGLTDTYSGKCA